MTNRAATIDGGDFSRYRRNALALLSLSARPGGIDVRPCDREKPPMEGSPGALFFAFRGGPPAGDDDCLAEHGISHHSPPTIELMPGCIAGETRDGEVGASCRLLWIGRKSRPFVLSPQCSSMNNARANVIWPMVAPAAGRSKYGAVTLKCSPPRSRYNWRAFTRASVALHKASFAGRA